MFCLLGTPFVVTAVFAAGRKAYLPSGLWVPINGRRAAVATVVASMYLLWLVFVGVRAIAEGDAYSMPVVVAGVYATSLAWAVAKAPRSGA